ncbi:Calx-beta domain-containing protein [Phaeobacter sp. PT47_59]|uniref:beta strand repeat-containing protein n=1 Tax=Phaeobacter sp. PT47_59 TaxID=3029979 RepID=UPI002380A921|nr:Calx-beta domain-containing protein [Phaeobacter sp. PT47_59]MDE4175210.1 Calx-beta domain-containing protein [Phaeobacter sp. PT47_59]
MTTLLPKMLRSLVLGLFLSIAGAVALTGPALATSPTPSFSTTFSPNTITAGGNSTLTFTITNNSGSAADSLGFSATLPTGITIAAGSQNNNCNSSTFTATAGGTTMSLADGRLGNGSSCTITLPVTSSTVATHTFTTGDLTSSLGNSGSATDDLTVNAAASDFTKSLSQGTIDRGQTTVLSYDMDITVASGGGSASFYYVTPSFSETLPAGLTFSSPLRLTSDCGGALTADTASGTLEFDGPTFQAAGSYTCTVTAELLAETSGTYVLENTVTYSSLISGSTSTASTTLTVNAAPSAGLDLLAAFSPSRVLPGSSSTLTFDLTNLDGSDSASNIGFTFDLDAMLSGLAVSGTLPSNPCGTGSTLSGTSLLTLSGGALDARSSCSFSVDVTVPGGATAGDFSQSSSAVSATLGGAPYTGPTATAALSVEDSDLVAPSLTKSFDDPVAPGDTVTLTYTLNNSSSQAASNISFQDIIRSPSGLSLVSGTGTQCGGTVSALFASGELQVQLVGGTLTAGDSCTFPLTLQLDAATAPGDYPGTSSLVTATIAGTAVSSVSSSDTLTVEGGANLSFVKSFDEDFAQAGADTGLTFTISSAAESPSTATAIAFTDDLSAMLAGTSFSSLTTNTCGGSLTGTTTLSYSGGTLAPGDSCTIALDIAIPGGASGTLTNTTSGLTATAGGEAATAPAASDSIAILSAQPLTLSAAYDASSVLPGDTVTLTYTLTNPNSTAGYSSIGFTDGYHSVLSSLAASTMNLSSGCSGGTASGTHTGIFSGISVLATETCTIDVTLTVPAGAADGSYKTTTSNVTASLNGSGVSLGQMSASFDVSTDLINMTKAFATSPVAAGTTVDLTYTLTNLSSTKALAGLAFTDDLDAALSGLAATGLPASTCGGTLSGTSTISFAGGSLAAGASCTITATLAVPSGAASGSYSSTSSTTSGIANPGAVAITGSDAKATVTVQSTAAPSFAKSFSSTGIPQGGSSTLTYVITNNDPNNAISDLRFSDDLDAVLSGMTVSAGTGSDLCGAGSTVSGSSTLTLSGGTLAAGASCSIDLTVTLPSGAALGSYTSTSSTLTKGGSYAAAAASASFTVEPAPTFDKAFAPTSVALGGTSTLTFTVDNSASAIAASALDFTDTLPAGLVVAPTPNASTTCTGGTLTATAGAGSIAYTGGTVAAGASCSVVVDTRALSVGSLANTSGDLTSSSGNSGSASATLTATAAPIPGFAKSFASASAPLGDVVTLTFTVDNASALIEASSLDFTDTLPAGMEVAATPNASTTCTGGSLTAAAGAGSISYSGGTVAAGASCSVMVDVTSTAAGTLSNTSGDLTSSLGNSGSASDTLTATPAPIPGFAKSFASASATLGDVVTLTFTVDNTSALVEASSLDFTDTLPAGMEVAAPPNASTTCTGGTLTAAAGAGSIAYTGGTVAASASCTVMVDVTSTATGTLSNTSGDLTSSLGNSGAASDSLNIPAIAIDSPLATDDVVNGTEAGNLTLSGTSSLIEDGQSVTLTVTDSTSGSVSGTTSVSSNAWSTSIDVTGLADGALSVSATVTDQAGSGSATASANLSKDATAPNGHSVSFDQDPLGAANESAASFTFAGAEVGSAFSYSISSDGGGSAVSGSGTIATATDQVTGLDLSALGSGTLTLSVVLTDTTGNAASAVTDTATKDTAAPGLAFDSPLAGDDLVGATEVSATSISGTTADLGDGLTVTVVVTDSASATVTGTATSSGNAWSLDMDLSGLADGALSLTADVSDAAGNPAPQATASLTKDTAAPSIAFDSPLAGDDVISDSEASATTISGTTANLGDGQVVTVVVTDSASATVTGTASTSAGAWSLDMDLSGLADGALSLTADVSDTAGNPAPQATASLTKDTAAPSIAFDSPLAGDDVVSDSEASATPVSGATTDIGDGQVVTVVITDSASATVTGTATSSSNAWSLDMDLSGLADGTLSLTADVSDATGNPAPQATTRLTKDTAAPSGYSVSFDQDPLDETNANAASFTFADAEPGATYDYSITSDGGGSAVSGSGTVATAASQVTGIDLSGLPDGTLTLTVTLSDTAGNSGAQATDTTALTANPPTATLSGPDEAQSDPFTVTLTFSTAVTGFALDDLEIDNGAASDLSGSDDSYSFTVTPEHDGTVTISLPAGAAQSAAGTESAAADAIEVTAVLTGTPDPNPPADNDGDGIPDHLESSTADRDGDGIPDAEDYDPQGYFYCEDDGRILSGGGLTVTGPSGSNSSVGIANDINIVRDGSSGEYQWFAQRPGTYTVAYSYPSTGIASTARLSSGTLDVTSLLPSNPAVIGSTEFGSTGFLADSSLAANPVFYDTFVIEAGDPNVLANNIPMTQCAENPVTLSAVDNGAEANGGTTDTVVFTVSQDRISTQDTVISYSLGGSATGGSDYTAPSGSVTITAGNTQATVEITVLEDVVIEGNETLTLTLSAVTAGDATTQLSTTTSDLTGSASITDDDFAIVSVSNDDLIASENGRDTAAMSFWLEGQPTSPVRLNFAGDAQCTVSPATLTFRSGNFATPQTLTITAIDDELVEGTHSCQPTVTVTSTDSNFDGFVLALAQVQILDDLVDQIRDRLTEVLKSDLEETIRTQQRYFSNISKGALTRLQTGQEGLGCGTQSAFDVDGTVQMVDGTGGTDGTFGYDVYNCQTGSREILDGSFTLNRTEGIGTQALLQFSRQHERFLSQSDLRGRFWGGYVSRNNVTDLADGTITGFGVNGGIYGARELGQGLFLDYYAAAAMGHHRYRLDFAALPTRIHARGSYDYAAAFAGAAISGQREYERFLLTPRLGLDLAYASVGDADVTASQLGQVDTGRIDMPDYDGGRIFLELEFASLPGTLAEGSQSAQIRTALAPRFACEMSSFDSDTDCGFGLAFSHEMIDALRGISYAFSIDFEQLDDTDRLSLDFSRERRFAAGQGAVVTRLSLPTTESVQIEHGLRLDF